jgi:ParB family chromosome partitioning protein
VLQPVVVRPLPGGEYELLAGERRLRAAEIVGLGAIPAVVREANDWERLDLALAENMARQNLNPVEQARACSMLVEDLGITKGEVGRRVGRSRVAISNLIRLLELPEEALELIEAGELSEGHGRAILTCKDHGERRHLALSARDEGWSVRETEARARQLEEESPRPRRAKVVVHPDLKEALTAAEDALSAAFSREVRVRPRGDRFRVELEVDNPAEAMELAERHLATRAESTRAAA